MDKQDLSILIAKKDYQTSFQKKNKTKSLKKFSQKSTKKIADTTIEWL